MKHSQRCGCRTGGISVYVCPCRACHHQFFSRNSFRRQLPAQLLYRSAPSKKTITGSAACWNFWVLPTGYWWKTTRCQHCAALTMRLSTAACKVSARNPFNSLKQLSMETKRHPALCAPDICTGCSACASICPQDAITMTADKEGFLQPIVDSSRCIECLVCETTCPVRQAHPTANRTRPAVFACWNRDKAERKESSSGGVFSHWPNVCSIQAAMCSARPMTAK